MELYKICSDDFFFPLPKGKYWIIALSYLPVIKTLITAITKLPKNDDNYGILASEHALMCVLRGSSIFLVKINNLHQL